MADYLWVDGILKPKAGQRMTDAVVKVNRAVPMLDKDATDTLAAISRFRIRTVLPLFDTIQYSFSLGLRSIGSSSMVTLDVPWGTSQFLFDYRHVAQYIDAALSVLCDSVGISEKPRFMFDPVNGLFGVASTESFRTAYHLFVSDDIQHCMNTFPFSEDSVDGEWWLLELADDVEMQPIKTLELLSPVNRIIIDTNIPIVKSMLPEPGYAADVSERTGGYMVDMAYTQNNNQSVAIIDFAVGEGVVYRWCNVIPRSQLSEFELSLYWMDNEENLRPMVIPRHGRVDIKTLFKTS